LPLNDLMRVLGQRKLLIGVVLLTTILTAFVSTKLVSPRYESSATLALTPKNASNDLLLFGTLDAIVPVYANAADARDTLDLAKNAIGGQLGSVTVETFTGTGIMKIRARSTSRLLAQRTAEGVAQALIQRTQTGAVGIPSLRLTELESAGLPTSPVFPRTKLTLLVATILGLAFGVGAALLRENLTTRVESADDLARSSGVPVFAEVPAEAAIPSLHTSERLKRDPRLRIVAEAFRDLRTNLLFSDDSISSILITSPDGSHGKTTISFGLATTLASAGARTLLIDADLRRGRIAELLQIDRPPGLMEVLVGQAELPEAIHRTPLENFDVLTGGHLGVDPGELLTIRFQGILEELQKTYDHIVIDGTPVVPISDARVVARYADATVLVVREHEARRRQVRSAVEKLDLISVKPIAAVLNYSRTVRSSSYYIQPGDADHSSEFPPSAVQPKEPAAEPKEPAAERNEPALQPNGEKPEVISQPQTTRTRRTTRR
jgi:capsular exopolysaccharide synthesis family protein